MLWLFFACTAIPHSWRDESLNRNKDSFDGYSCIPACWFRKFKAMYPGGTLDRERLGKGDQGPQAFTFWCGYTATRRETCDAAAYSFAKLKPSERARLLKPNRTR